MIFKMPNSIKFFLKIDTIDNIIKIKNALNSIAFIITLYVSNIESIEKFIRFVGYSTNLSKVYLINSLTVSSGLELNSPTALLAIIAFKDKQLCTNNLPSP